MGKISFEKIEGDDACKLDELFGFKDCMIEVNPGKVLLPQKFKDIAERVENLSVRPDDIWLVSYPRTGSTWTQEMVWLIGHDLDYEGAKALQTQRAPLVELSALMDNQHSEMMKDFGNSVDIVEAMPSPRFIKTHLPVALLPKDMEKINPKIIYVARNPKDMCVSYYHYCQYMYNLQGSLEEFCELFLKDMTPFGSVWNHILGFWKRRDDPNVLFLKYEDMKKDQEAAIKKTATFLNKEISDEDIKILADHLSFNKMQSNPAVNLEPLKAHELCADFLKKTDKKFLRKGQVGDFKNHMSPEMIDRFDRWTEKNLNGSGLSFTV